ncbi:hypothetical protein M3Y99_00215300 [Aphelenchoides fujianensis]|nr:hypothetical protein M3Y99_00215300 [Aphelenchoides fujianensis]
MNSIALLFLLVLFVRIDSKSACESQCYHDQSPRCATTLIEENVRNASGVYEIFDGVLNFVCAFRSLPTPVEVRWKYRSRSENRLHDVPCAKLNKKEVCSTNADGEHEVRVECLLRLNRLDLGGAYKCEGVQESGTLVASQHADVEVIGIESAAVSSTSLRVGHHGHVCAHPPPEIFWILPDGRFLQAAQSAGRHSAGSLAPTVEFEAERPNGAGRYRPYCFTNRLVVGQVEAEDSQLAVVVRNAAETRRLDLALRTRNSAASFTFNRFLFVWAFCLMRMFG